MMGFVLLILLPVTAAALSTLLARKVSKVFILFIQSLLTAAAWILFFYVKAQGTISHNLGGWPEYIGITLRADVFSSVMILLTTLLFLSIMLFDWRTEYANKLFLFLILTLEALIIGIFLSRDLFTIFVLVEVATVVISILIMFKRDSQAIYDGMIYLLISAVAMLFFLFGIGQLYKIFGVVDLFGIGEKMSLIKNTRSLILPYTFIITAISLKAAMLPLFSWLPKAHGTPSAPGVVSAILSGVYVKVGLYLFLRIQTAFSLRIDMSEYFMLIGFLTAVVGFLFALSQKDIKLILAYHTVSQVGLIMMAVNMGNFQAYWGGVYHIINHAFFKATLFLTAGVIIDSYKTRNIYKIRGVFRRMPMISLAAIFAILGITGAPFFNGSISKYWIAYGAKDSLGEGGLLLVNLGTVLSFVKYAGIFFGKEEGEVSKPDSISSTIAFIMGSMCFFGGIFGRQFISFMFGHHMLIDPVSYGIKVLYFMGTLILGIVLYHGLIKRTQLLHRLYALELSFNGMCMAIVLFFGCILIYMSFKYPA